MAEPLEIPDKLFYKIGEVCQYTDTQPYVLRFWESEFPQLAPEKDRKGQRVYRRQDIELIFRIKKLLYEEEYTIAGARRRLEQESTGEEAEGPEPERAPKPRLIAEAEVDEAPRGARRLPLEDLLPGDAEPEVTASPGAAPDDPLAPVREAIETERRHRLAAERERDEALDRLRRETESLASELLSAKERVEAERRSREQAERERDGVRADLEAERRQREGTGDDVVRLRAEIEAERGLKIAAEQVRDRAKARLKRASELVERALERLDEDAGPSSHA